MHHKLLSVAAMHANNPDRLRPTIIEDEGSNMSVMLTLNVEYGIMQRRGRR